MIIELFKQFEQLIVTVLYSGIPIFRTSKVSSSKNREFEKSKVAPNDPFYRGIVLQDPRRQTTTV